MRLAVKLCMKKLWKIFDLGVTKKTFLKIRNLWSCFFYHPRGRKLWVFHNSLFDVLCNGFQFLVIIHKIKIFRAFILNFRCLFMKNSFEIDDQALVIGIVWVYRRTYFSSKKYYNTEKYDVFLAIVNHQPRRIWSF